jgi:hypothetical protein
MKLTTLAAVAFAALAFTAPVAAQEGPYGLLTVNGVMLYHVIVNDYDDRIEVDGLGLKEIERQTDGTIATVSKGKTLTNGNGGVTTFSQRAIPNALCEKYTEKFGADDPRAMDYCDKVVNVATSSGGGQSSHYLGDVHGTAEVCDVSVKERTGGFRTGFFIETTDTQNTGPC